MSAPFVVPAALRAASPDEDRADWLASLPDVVEAARQRWRLAVLAPFEPGGTAAWVAPARRESGEPVVLKVGWPHPEGTDEAAGLEWWDGDGAVRLIETATINGAPALLLERCAPGVSLAALATEEEQDVVVAGLLQRLWREPPPAGPFRPLHQMCVDWADAAERRLAEATGADSGLIEAGLDVFRGLPAAASDEVVLFTDLHAGNVLSARRERWLAIDPKPYVGDRCYDVLQHLLNCDRLRIDPESLLQRIAGLTGLDPIRLRQWLFARCAVEAVDDPELAGIAARLAP